MKFFVSTGEAFGDLHLSYLVKSVKARSRSVGVVGNQARDIHFFAEDIGERYYFVVPPTYVVSVLYGAFEKITVGSSHTYALYLFSVYVVVGEQSVGGGCCVLDKYEVIVCVVACYYASGNYRAVVADDAYLCISSS